MRKDFTKNFWLWCFILSGFVFSSAYAQINNVGGFEGELPSYWMKGVEPTGSTLTWATDQSRNMGKSLKIEKSATSEAAVWESENMTDLWSPQNYKDVDIKIGAYVKTENVNTNPANDDARWYVSYTFYDSAGVLIGETMLPIDQSVATSSGWVADTNGIGETVLPKDSWKTIIKFVGGKDATGTVWADDFMLVGRSGGWAGQDWNTSVGMPTGWNYWLPPVGGNDGELNKGYENTVVTDEAAHSGSYSLKFDLPFDRVVGDAWVGTRRYLLTTIDSDIKAGDKIRISVMVKASNLVPDSAALYPGTWSVGFTPIFHSGYMNNDAYDEIGAKDLTFTFPSVTSFDWKEFTTDVTVPDNESAKALSVRLHIYSRFTGTVYFDDLKVTKLAVSEITEVGGFEGELPSYWMKGVEPTGSTLTWATDQSRNMGKSLKIEKSATSEAAVWESENMTDLWSPQNYKDVDIKVGAYVRTENVNTNPANDDAKWYVSYTFYDSANVLIGETMLPIDQSVATSSGWVADTNGIGETVLPKDSWKTIVKFVGGKDATGTVWADDFMLVGRSGGWAGQDWNTSVGMPTGWNYWLPPVGGNDGELNKGYENTVVTDEAAHSGNYSLKFDLPFDRAVGDAWVGTRRFLLNPDVQMSIHGSKDISVLNNIQPGDVLKISVMVKASNLVPDSAALYPGTWSVGFTPIFHSGYMNNDAYDEIGAKDLTFEFPNVTEFDWTKYSVEVTVPDNESAKALSVRLHIYSRFTGTVYFDDLTVEKVTQVGVEDEKNTLPSKFELANNYPNPFNPTTIINYTVPQYANVTIAVYNILGKRIATLTNKPHNPGNYSVTWNGADDAGLKVSSGVYFYSLTTNNISIVKKMILMK